MLQHITANFDGIIRHDKMEGRDFIVAPMVMIVEGVLNGSGGPLLYPKEELEKTPAIWNMKPVVVYHPSHNGQPVSACDPDILSNRKVGVIMNTRFEDGKLKAEAWLEASRMDAVDERISQAIENKETMELSTGLYSDNESMQGEWEGTHYDAIARNYRPDHLALLPDLTGACSIEDGAGFIRNVLIANSDKIKMIGNELSHGNIRSLLNSWLQEKEGPNDAFWVEEVFDSFFIYIDDGKFFKQDYSVEDNKLTVEGDRVEVVRITEFRTLDGTFVGNKKDSDRKDLEMKKKEKIVKELIDNESTSWTKDNKETLMGLEEDVLSNMFPIVDEDVIKANEKKVTEAAIKGYKESLETNEDNDEKKKKPTVNQKPITEDEYIANAPESMRGMLKNHKKTYDTQKAKLVEFITANDQNIFTPECLEKKDIEELTAIAKLSANKEEEIPGSEPVANYIGQGSIVDNHKEEPLVMPSLEVAKAS